MVKKELFKKFREYRMEKKAKINAAKAYEAARLWMYKHPAAKKDFSIEKKASNQIYITAFRNEIEKNAMIKLDINMGDYLLGGRFKNQRMTVKSIGTDDLGQPTVNKKKLLSFRIEKKMPADMQSGKTKREKTEMEKGANVQRIYQAAFLDEIEKIARYSGTYDDLNKHRVPLTPEERSKVMAAKAVWHHGPHGEATPAVWKSVNKKTKKTYYVTNTHRAFNTGKTVKAAINRYHKFTKGTA